jgi:putative hydrolase of the HAD superfamily
MSARPALSAVVFDLGGVLTTPLLDAFLDYERSTGISPQAFAIAMFAVAQHDGENPLFALERGEISERQFLASLEDALGEQLGRPVSLEGFGEAFMAGLRVNEPMLAFVRELRGRGHRLALCTNNVREWEPLWRPKLPVEELFEVVVDSSVVGARKPEREIYELTLARLEVAPEQALLIDDVEENCEAARELGWRAVWFRSSEQAIAEVERALAAAAR